MMGILLATATCAALACAEVNTSTILFDKSCRALMEVAMRAMDEFVREPTEVTLEYKPPATRLREAADTLDRQARALRLWEETKKECWREP
jgi:hypothetical protein